MKCELDAEGHCITCSDEAIAATVQRVDQEMGVAFVTTADAIEEVDISLIEDVAAGDIILVHGGVAIGIAGVDADRLRAGLAPILENTGMLANKGIGETSDA